MLSPGGRETPLLQGSVVKVLCVCVLVRALEKEFCHLGWPVLWDTGGGVLVTHIWRHFSSWDRTRGRGLESPHLLIVSLRWQPEWYLELPMRWAPSSHSTVPWPPQTGYTVPFPQQETKVQASPKPLLS